MPINKVRGSDFWGAVAKTGWVLAVVGADVVGLGGGVGGTEALVIEDRAVKVAGGGVAGLVGEVLGVDAGVVGGVEGVEMVGVDVNLTAPGLERLGIGSGVVAGEFVFVDKGGGVV